MWLPSLVTGMMVDKIGARLTAISSGVALLISGLILALVLLGVGWNLGLISGTTLVCKVLRLPRALRHKEALTSG